MMLAIESAISGGSLSLLDANADEIGSWIGGGAEVLRAEHLISRIDALLKSASATKHELAGIAVSSGPGSFTGIRIGIAIALGLTNGLGIPMFSSSILEAIVIATPSGDNGNARRAAIVPMGRGAACLQSFEVDGSSLNPMASPYIQQADELRKIVENSPGIRFLVHSDLYDAVSSVPNVRDAGENMAIYIARHCLAVKAEMPPIFLSKGF